MFKWLLEILFGFGIKPEPPVEETTQHFKDFVKFYFIENPQSQYESHNNLLCRYMFTTKKSPFVGDTNFEQAKTTLRRNGIWLFE